MPLDARQVVLAMQARLICRSGIRGKLLKKHDAPESWMEIYEQVTDPDRFERLLDQAVDEFDVEMFLETLKKECFCLETDETLACTRP